MLASHRLYCRQMLQPEPTLCDTDDCSGLSEEMTVAPHVPPPSCCSTVLVPACHVCLFADVALLQEGLTFDVRLPSLVICI